MTITELINKLIELRDEHPMCGNLEFSDESGKTYAIESVFYDPATSTLPDAIVIKIDSE